MKRLFVHFSFAFVGAICTFGFVFHISFFSIAANVIAGNGLSCATAFTQDAKVVKSQVRETLAQLDESIVQTVGSHSYPIFDSRQSIEWAYENWRTPLDVVQRLGEDPSDLIAEARNYPLSFELVLYGVAQRISRFSEQEKFEVIANIPQSWLKAKVSFLLHPFLKDSPRPGDRAVLRRLRQLIKVDEYSGEHSTVTAIWLIQFLSYLESHKIGVTHTQNTLSPWPRNLTLQVTKVPKKILPILKIIGFDFSEVHSDGEKTSPFIDAKNQILNTTELYQAAQNLNRMEGKGDLLYAFGVGAACHDLGKAFIPTDILNKPASLTHEEYRRMMSHPLGTFAILQKTLKGDERQNWVPLIGLLHHERWDGEGYPLGLKGDQIPFVVRAMSVVDTYHAMTSTRPYRMGLSYDTAANILEQEADQGQLDPTLSRAFVDMVRLELAIEKSQTNKNRYKKSFN